MEWGGSAPGRVRAESGFWLAAGARAGSVGRGGVVRSQPRPREVDADVRRRPADLLDHAGGRQASWYDPRGRPERACTRLPIIAESFRSCVRSRRRLRYRRHDGSCLPVYV
jgi:hypothetical protein